MLKSVCLSQQPIFNQYGEVLGYEIAFPGHLVEGEAGKSDLSISKQSFVDLLDIGIHQVAGHKPVFIDAGSHFFLHSYHQILPKEQVGLKVPSCVTAMVNLQDNDVWKEDFLVILDLQEDEYRVERNWLERANYLRIPVNERNKWEQLRSWRSKTIFANINDYEHYQAATQMGGQFFQGDFFRRPNLKSHKIIEPAQMSVMQALQKVIQAEDLSEIEEVLVKDVGLAYRLFKFLNSAAFAFRHEISSVKQAVSLLGKKQIQFWLTALSFQSLNEHKPIEILRTALIRARMMELIAEMDEEEVATDAFLVGMFSLLDAMLDQPMDEILSSLTLPEAVHQGLNDPYNRNFRLLEAIRTMESQGWEAAFRMFADLGLKISTITAFHWEATNWATKQMDAWGQN